MKFDSYHPMINFIYFTAALICVIVFDHPVMIVLSYAASFIYSVKLGGRRILLFNAALIPLGIIYTFIYSYYNHFGITVLGINSIGNYITMEAIVYGAVIAVRAAAAIMMFTCVLSIVTTDKVVYLFGRISPKLSLFISVILRAVPRIKVRARRIGLSRAGIGRGVRQGNIFWRVRNLLALISIVITWTLEDFVESSVSMQSRGYTLKGRTAFSIYRFDNRDRGVLMAMYICIVILCMAQVLGETTSFYDPEIMWRRITWMSIVVYVIYGIFLLIPFGLQVAGEEKMRRLRKL